MRILLDLSALGRGDDGDSRRLCSQFVPELVALRPDDDFVAAAPTATAELVTSWGVTTGTPLQTRGFDVVLAPATRRLGLAAALTPRIMWVNGPVSTRGGRRLLTLAALGRAAQLVYPTAAARYAAERAGVRRPGLILRPPLTVGGASAPAAPENRERSGPLNVLVPVHGPGANLALLPRLSAVLAGRGFEHHLRVTGRLPAELTSATVSGGADYVAGSATLLREQFDAVLLPSVTASYSYPLVEFEHLGVPVAASNIDAHLELRARAQVFEPASPHGAADALLASIADNRGGEGGPASSRAAEPEWRFNTPRSYSLAISTEIDRLLEHGEPWHR